MKATDPLDGLLSDPLRSARAAVNSGARAVGYVGTEVPVELILAAGALPVRLTGQVGAPTPNADRYIEASFSPESRSIAEQWLTGQFDFLDAVIFPRTDDSAQRLYYYLCELQRMQRHSGPKPLIYDLPRVLRPTSSAHAVDSTLRLAQELGARSERLPEAVATVSDRRTLLANVFRARLRAQSITGTYAHRIGRAAWQTWDSGVAQLLEKALAQAERTTSGGRLALIGSELPDERIHAAIEGAGANAVLEVTETTAFAGIAINAPQATIERIAACYHQQSVRQRALLRSPQLLMRELQRSSVNAAIVWMIEEDTGIAWELPQWRQALVELGIPALVLTRQPWVPDAQALDEIARFIRSLERTP